SFLMRQVDRDVLPLRVALEHAFEGELTADAAFFVTAVGMTWALTEAGSLEPNQPRSRVPRAEPSRCHETRRRRRARNGCRSPCELRPLRRSKEWRQARGQRSPRARGASRWQRSRRWLGLRNSLRSGALPWAGDRRSRGALRVA